MSGQSHGAARALPRTIHVNGPEPEGTALGEALAMEIDGSVNVDHETVLGFGEEWSAYDQSALREDEHAFMFQSYFSPLFSFDNLGEGFDLGCGSGRWAQHVAPKVGKLHCIDPADQALTVARRNLEGHPNVVFHLATANSIPLPDDSQDFGYSLGVIHHIPDPEHAMRMCVQKLKPGAQFLVYLYYKLDNRPAWYRALWRVSDGVRRGISRLPFRVRKATTSAIATAVYLPLARAARLAEKAGLPVAWMPLSTYRTVSFYTMRTDALDRFGTRLEHRFSKTEIEAMMIRCGLENIRFREGGPPYWVACGTRALKGNPAP